MRVRTVPADPNTCRYPDLAPTTAYNRRCRCPRCKGGIREYNERRRQRRRSRNGGPWDCQRCGQGASQVQVAGHLLCFPCLTEAERAQIRQDTYRGRYAHMGWATYGDC